MSGFLGKAKNITGIGLDHNELYSRAFEKGVLLKKFIEAADLFDKASKKYVESGNPMMAAQARANSLLYRYLATGDTGIVTSLLQTLQGLQQIEEIGSQTSMMPVEPLRAELDCRLVESAITNAQYDVISSRDLHNIARGKFQTIIRNPLITYNYVPAVDGHNDKAEARFFFHGGMYSFYEAMTKKDTDPSAASDDLSLANQSFKRCNDQKWQHTVAMLLDNWRISRTCWLCHRDMQGYELHYSMCHAEVTPYTKIIMEKAKEDSSTINIEKKQIAVCTPCGSMVTFKAQEEADKVRRELNAKLDHAMSVIHTLESRVSHLERMAHHH